MMPTAQRPAYNRASQTGKSSTTGLVLNFSPLEFELGLLRSEHC